MTGKGLICKLGQHTAIEAADNIVQVDMFGETIITQKNTPEGTIGILFDMETCLSHEYASLHNMYRHSGLNYDKTVKGYLEDDRRIRAVRLKGVKCSALFMPLNLNVKPALSLGQEIDQIAGVKICEKYISKKTQQSILNREGKVKENIAPTFKEHFDTDQWGRNSHLIKDGNLVIITEKLHGTSGRCGYLQIDTKDKISKWKLFLDKLIWGNKAFYKSYEFVVGSRRVIKSISEQEHGNKEHFYETDLWTSTSKEYFEGKLKKGETVYFEIVGYTPEGSLIMSSVSNSKLKNFLSKKEYEKFINMYGQTTYFTYGTDKTYKVFVYRITRTNEDGDTIDLSWDQVKTRCEQLAVDHAPELSRFITDTNYVSHLETATEQLVNKLTNSESNMFPEHIKEGVCIRVENGSLTPKILKSKSFIFKVLEGIVKDTNTVDIEESN